MMARFGLVGGCGVGMRTGIFLENADGGERERREGGRGGKVFLFWFLYPVYLVYPMIEGRREEEEGPGYGSWTPFIR